jgi:TonB-dependent starch-binding outer membrane protein SusC
MKGLFTKKLFLPQSRKYRKPLSLIFLSFFLFVFTGYSQVSSIVKGRVVDETGQPIKGASIVVKGLSTGVTSDDNGDFAINAAPNSILVISFVGYSNKEVPLKGKSNLTVTLTESGINLNAVVVVGYGTQKSKDVTGAISKITSQTLLQTAASSALDQMKGHIAGVDITSTSAVPGGGSQIRIRGNRTMVANTPSASNASFFLSDATAASAVDGPLYVVDGIPYSGNLSDISPNDIASMEILKDASATAIYGSRGAGGVIIITTKRGENGKTSFNYNAYIGISSVIKQLPVYDGKRYAQLNADAAAGNSGTAGVQPWPLSNAEQAGLDGGVSTNWQNLIYQQAPITNNNLSILGGNEKSKYALSIGYFFQGGAIPHQDYTRYNIRGAMDHQVSKRIKIGLTTMNSLSIQNLPGGSGVTNGMMRITPLLSPYNADGTVNLSVQTGSVDNFINPLTLKTQSAAILARTTTVRTFNSMYGEVEIVDGLKYRINVGLDYSHARVDNYSGPGTFINTSLLQSQSTASIQNTDSWQYTVEHLLYYNKTFNEKHQLGLTALYSFQGSGTQNSYFAAQGIPFNSLLNTNFYPAASINAGPAPTTGSPTNPNSNYNWKRGLISYMGRATYSYDSRYSLTATVRDDGASVLSPGNQYFIYPAFAAAWNIMNEKFMSKVTAINNLKLRIGWGIAASQGINPYSTLGLLGSSAYNFGQGAAGQQGGYNVSSLPNSSLKWQSTSEYNFGLDFGIFRNRISGSLEVYSQKTKNILLPVSLPPSQGGGTVYQNLGKTQGNGMELTISTVNIQSARGFKWNTDFNIFLNREKILELASPTEKSDLGNGWFVGQPITVIYDYKKLGIWQTGDPGLTTQTSPVQHPGDIKILDVDGNGKITPADEMVLGNFQPKFETGMTNSFSYKSFDLSFSMYAKIGMKVVVPYLSSETGGANFTGYNWFLTGRNNQLVVDYWTPTNPTNKFPQPDASGTPQYSSTLSYVDGSFIKCRTINIGYQLPGGLLQKVKFSSLRVYVSVVNPFVIWSPFVKDGYGPDPEGNGFGGTINATGTSNSGAVGRAVTVNANIPATRQVIFGLNLNF